RICCGQTISILSRRGGDYLFFQRMFRAHHIICFAMYAKLYHGSYNTINIDNMYKIGILVTNLEYTTIEVLGDCPFETEQATQAKYVYLGVCRTQHHFAGKQFLIQPLVCKGVLLDFSTNFWINSYRAKEG